jgi:hypothetical protein
VALKGAAPAMRSATATPLRHCTSRWPASLCRIPCRCSCEPATRCDILSRGSRLQVHRVTEPPAWRELTDARHSEIACRCRNMTIAPCRAGGCAIDRAQRGKLNNDCSHIPTIVHLTAPGAVKCTIARASCPHCAIVVTAYPVIHEGADTATGGAALPQRSASQCRAFMTAAGWALLRGASYATERQPRSQVVVRHQPVHDPVHRPATLRATT